MEFAKTNAKVESCMSLLIVVIEDVKFIKSHLLDGSKSNIGKRDEGIPRTDGEHGLNHEFKESGDAGVRHNVFETFESTPLKQEWNPNESTKVRPKSWSWNKESVQVFLCTFGFFIVNAESRTDKEYV
ncbi:hypothetical protein COLO4_25315 [Corchorus olitorius]|uniref:Uncharacterized protein n=1 Tax=Corchorus olitorius TaxID=93759 RepID=A0A1R3I3J1_9ROSI|nr:hypothetical protein COLO4_25315 [Corchorus olitorius]